MSKTEEGNLVLKKYVFTKNKSRVILKREYSKKILDQKRMKTVNLKLEQMKS